MTLPASAHAASHAAPKRVFGWLFAVAILAVIGAYVRAMYFTPIEALQGAVQKIYYLHVPAWIACYLAYGLVAVGSVINLWLHDERADRLAASASEVGILFNTVGLTVGPLWASRSAIRARSGGMPSSSSSKMVRKYISVVSISPCAVTRYSLPRRWYAAHGAARGCPGQGARRCTIQLAPSR